MVSCTALALALTFVAGGLAPVHAQWITQNNALKAGWNRPGTANGGPADREFNWNYNYHNNPFWEQLVNNNADP